MRLLFKPTFRTIVVAAVLIVTGSGCFLKPTEHSKHGPIHDYARDGNLALVTEDLATNSADLNLPDDAGLTPLHLATLHCHTNVVTFLLEKHAKVNLASDDGTTPLHLAAQEGCLDVLIELLAHDAKVNPRDNQNRTPLARAEAWHQDQAADFLRNHGGIK
jgi:ankyrin repeat protein